VEVGEKPESNQDTGDQIRNKVFLPTDIAA
jgi:hypothetical protein